VSGPEILAAPRDMHAKQTRKMRS